MELATTIAIIGLVTGAGLAAASVGYQGIIRYNACPGEARPIRVNRGLGGWMIASGLALVALLIFRFR